MNPERRREEKAKRRRRRVSARRAGDEQGRAELSAARSDLGAANWSVMVRRSELVAENRRRADLGKRPKRLPAPVQAPRTVGVSGLRKAMAHASQAAA